MINKTQTKIAIGIAAVIWFAVAVATNQDAQMTALKTFSIAGTVVTILFLLYDRFIWKWTPVRAITKKPLVAGTWRGMMQSDYVRPGEATPVPPIPTVIRFKQTNSSLVATLFTGESESMSEQAQLIKEEDDRWRLSWVYRNTPRQSVQERQRTAPRRVRPVCLWQGRRTTGWPVLHRSEDYWRDRADRLEQARVPRRSLSFEG